MAGAQFSTSQPKSAIRKSRRFTIAEANRTLPLVSRIVRDIVATHERASQLQAQLEQVPGARETVELQGRLEAAVDQLQDYVDELSEIGCELRDYPMGLVDYPGEYQGRDVYLCWKLGESRIEYFHDVETGFAGRQPIEAGE
jgi:hypothetical protein